MDKNEKYLYEFYCKLLFKDYYLLYRLDKNIINEKVIFNMLLFSTQTLKYILNMYYSINTFSNELKLCIIQKYIQELILAKEIISDEFYHDDIRYNNYNIVFDYQETQIVNTNSSIKLFIKFSDVFKIRDNIGSYNNILSEIVYDSKFLNYNTNFEILVKECKFTYIINDWPNSLKTKENIILAIKYSDTNELGDMRKIIENIPETIMDREILKHIILNINKYKGNLKTLLNNTLYLERFLDESLISEIDPYNIIKNWFKETYDINENKLELVVYSNNLDEIFMLSDNFIEIYNSYIINNSKA